MIRSYLKVALRGLRKNRLISFINIFGLGLSMSVGMMVMIRLQDQLSFDNFHPHPETTFRILSDYHKNTGEHWKMATTPLPLNDKLHDLSGIENSVSIYPYFNGKATAGGKEIYLNGAFTGPSFFQVFGFSLAAGNPLTALQKPDGVILSKNTAEKFFGTQNPLGKIFTMESGQNFIVTGMLNETPGKSHLNYDVYVSMTAIPQLEKDKFLANKSADWYAFNSTYTYVVLKKGYSSATFSKELNAIAAGINKDNKEGRVEFPLQPIGKITPGSDNLYYDTSYSSWSKFYFEIGIALIILMAACFNYTNLTIARALTRAKEVGVRKINGANRIQIFIQYIIESLLIALLSLCFAWVLLSFIVQYAPFNDGYEFIPSTFRYNRSFVLSTIVFALFTGLLAGASPAWILSSFKPLRVLKNLTTARILGKVSLQKTLIVFQYSLSLTIIIFLLAFYRQFSHLAAADPGFKRDKVLVVPLNGIEEKIATRELMQIPGVSSVSAMSATLTGHFGGFNFPVWLNNKQDAISLNYYFSDAAFIRDMKLSIIAGRNFSAVDADKEKYVLINEQGVKALGIKDYQQAVGQKIWINDSAKLEIAGVLKDFHYVNAGSPVMPLAFRNKENAFNYLYLSVDNTDNEALSNRIQKVMIGLAPSQTFNLTWLDEQLAKNNSQAATISLLGYLAFMAIAIASLGLLGLVMYTVQVKRKEISIRKIIGAESSQLVKLLSKGFIKLLFIAGFIAMPLGYTAGFLFLQNFSDRIHFGAGNALLCFSLLLIIGLVTIMSQTYKAAVENPVKSLRNE